MYTHNYIYSQKPITVNKLFFIALTLLLFSNSSGQTCGVYEKAEDFQSNRPFKGTSFVEIHKPGENVMILTTVDGSKERFDIGSFWGYFRLTAKKENLTTQYRHFENEFYPIYSVGELIVCFHPATNGKFTKIKDGQPFFEYEEGYKAVYFSKGAAEPLEMATEVADFKRFMKPELFEKVVEYQKKNPKLHLAMVAAYYNKLAANGSTE